MMIIGCDFHPSWQQIAWLDNETGEPGESRLVQAAGEAQKFYAQLAVPSRLGMEATGNSHWFIELVEDLGHRGRADSSQLRAQAEDRQTGCCPHFEAAAGRSVSAIVDTGPGAAGFASAGVTSAQAGGDPGQNQKRTATPFHE